MNKVVEELSKIGIVPVIALDDAKDAEPLAKALIEGGLPCAEVTFRTAQQRNLSVSWLKSSRTCCRSRYSINTGAGRQSHECRSKVYCQSGTES